MNDPQVSTTFLPFAFAKCTTARWQQPNYSYCRANSAIKYREYISADRNALYHKVPFQWRHRQQFQLRADFLIVFRLRRRGALEHNFPLHILGIATPPPTSRRLPRLRFFRNSGQIGGTEVVVDFGVDCSAVLSSLRGRRGSSNKQLRNDQMHTQIGAFLIPPLKEISTSLRLGRKHRL